MAGEGARIIIKSRYLNPAKNAAGGAGIYAQYIGTREGSVNITEDRKTDPASEAQKKLIEETIKEHPELEKKLSYTEYKGDQTVENAHRFLNEAFEALPKTQESIDRYAAYMATRPGVVNVHSNGLFSDSKDEINMHDLKEELKHYQGNIYLPIISLRQEDSEGYGYDNPEAWQKLLHEHREDIAKAYNIKPENLNWIAAYHHAVNDDGVVHNHVHMMVWSKNPSEGWQTPETGTNLRRALANDIFAEENKQNLTRLDESRDELRNRAREIVSGISKEIEAGHIEKMNDGNQKIIAGEILALAEKLTDVKGRMAYQCMPRDIKHMIDNITDDLFDSDPTLQKTLQAWADAKNRQTLIYQNDAYKLPPVSQIADFKPVKNKILREAGRLSMKLRDFSELEATAPDYTANASKEQTARKRGRPKKQTTHTAGRRATPAESRAMAADTLSRTLSRSRQQLLDNVARLLQDTAANGRKRSLKTHVTESEEERAAKAALGIHS